MELQSTERRGWGEGGPASLGDLSPTCLQVNMTTDLEGSDMLVEKADRAGVHRPAEEDADHERR